MFSLVQIQSSKNMYILFRKHPWKLTANIMMLKKDVNDSD